MSSKPTLREDPPPRAGNPTGGDEFYNSVAAQARKARNKWVRLNRPFSSRRAAAAIAWRINSGHIVAFQEGEWRAVSRTVDGEPRVYVMYRGG